MNRRDFTRLGGLGALGLWFGPGQSDPRGSGLDGARTSSVAPPGGRAVTQVLEVDGPRLEDRMRRLATFGANDAGGIDRVAFSDANVEALEWVESLLADADFSVERDMLGELVRRNAGSLAGLPSMELV